MGDIQDMGRSRWGGVYIIIRKFHGDRIYQLVHNFPSQEGGIEFIGGIGK